MPVVEDMVLGVVLEKHSETVKVDLGSASAAVLPMLAFEGASRKNRPNLNVRPSSKKKKVALNNRTPYCQLMAKSLS